MPNRIRWQGLQSRPNVLIAGAGVALGLLTTRAMVSALRRMLCSPSRGLRESMDGYVKRTVNEALDQQWQEIRPEWYTDEFQSALASARRIFEDKLHGTALRQHGLQELTGNFSSVLASLLLLRRVQLHELDSEGGASTLGEPTSPLDEPMLARAHAFVRHAEAVYSSSPLEASWAVRHVATAELTGVDIKYPRHAVVVDHALRAVVLVVRGTASAADAVTDALCDEAPLCEGVAHAGFLGSARALVAAVSPAVQAALAANPGFSVAVTGHSLGGGVAILAGLLLHTERASVQADTLVEVWAFAPGTIFSPVEAFPAHRLFKVRSFVHHVDLVPRLSLRSIFRLYHTLVGVELQIRESERQHLHSISKVLAGGAVPPELAEGVVRCMREAEAAAEEAGGFPDMQVAGELFLLSPVDLETRERYILRSILPRHLSSPLPYNGDSCVADHSIVGYRRALERLQPAPAR